jgi:hypothetical protein
VELLVVMPVLLIVTGLVLATLTTAYGAESRVQTTAQASSQVTLAFMALDSEIRYAADINQPWPTTNNAPAYFVSFQSDWKQNAQGQSLCTQVEYNNSTGQLLQGSWYGPATGPTAWQVLASGLENTKTSGLPVPFSLSNNQGNPWQLSVTITAASSVGSTKGTAQSAFTITSLDTNASSKDSGICGGP